MFDYVRCHKDLGDGNDWTDCQTKDIADDWMGGFMDTYWIDPAGKVFLLDTSQCFSYEYNESDSAGFFGKFKRVSTGIRGRVTPTDITDYVVIYPTNFHGEWKDRPVARLHIVCGQVESFTLKKEGQRW